jgi:hypothetical protein
MSGTDTCLITVPGWMRAITQGVVLIQIPKGLVVLTRQQFVDALKVGKRWKRAEALRARQAPLEAWDAGAPGPRRH